MESRFFFFSGKYRGMKIVKFRIESKLIRRVSYEFGGKGSVKVLDVRGRLGGKA